jgi:geranylgeranyl diphosphate synthase type II
MIELKTAALVAASLKIGAMTGGADDKDSDLLFEFGRNLGLAFQIQDDMLDIWGDTSVFGKAQAGDIVANKKTFPLIKAMEIASGNQLEKLREQLTLKDPDPEEKVRTIKSIFDDLKIKEVTDSLANDYIESAFGLLNKVSVNTARKKELENVASSLIGRIR